MRDKKNLIIAALLFALVAMSIGYAAFSDNLNINGSASVSGNWDVEITGITSSFTGTAIDKTPPSFTATTATFNALLNIPGETATYTITVQNKGTIDAKLSSITLTPQEGSDAIIYTVISKPNEEEVLHEGETANVVIEARYDENVTKVPEVKTKTFTGVLEYVQAD